MNNHHANKDSAEHALVQAGVMIKLGMDVHARQITVCRQIGDRTPQPVQVFTKEAMLVWVKQMIKAGAIVHSCYEAGVMGYTLRRELLALGATNLVGAPPPKKKTGGSEEAKDRCIGRACLGRSTRPLAAWQPGRI